MSTPAAGTHVYKFILIGNAGVGKTAAAQSFANGKPNATTQYKATIGVDYAVRELSIGQSTASVQIWDIAGEQRFGTMTKTYFRGAHAVIIMFDLTNEVSWEDVDIWRQDVFAKLGASANELPVLVVGNKLDLISEMRPSVTNDDELYEFVSRHGLWKGIKLSAKTDTKFSEAVKEMVEILHTNAPSKPVTLAEQQIRSSGSLRVISTKSPVDSRSDSPSKTRPERAGSKPTVVKPKESSRASSNDDDGIYTHTEAPESNRSDCCVIS